MSESGKRSNWESVIRKLKKDGQSPSLADCQCGFDIGSPSGRRYVVLIQKAFTNPFDEEDDLYFSLLNTSCLFVASAGNRSDLLPNLVEKPLPEMIETLIKMKMEETPEIGLDDLARWLGKSVPTARRIRDKVRAGASVAGSIQLNRGERAG